MEENRLLAQNKKNIKKASLDRIDISALPDRMPDFRNSDRTKDSVLADWMINWIEKGLKDKRLKPDKLLPQKHLIASKVNVSVGTVQTAIRMIEDKGYVESKQRLGTFICDINNPGKEIRKLTSKRENAVAAIKNHILCEKYNIGDMLPSSRELSKIIGSAPNTTRSALEFLVSEGIVETKTSLRNKSNRVLKAMPECTTGDSSTMQELNADTLVDQVERDIKQLILNTYEPGDKLMSHYELSDKLKVSIKTVHDAMKRLTEQGILQSKRGRYGTFILRMPSDKNVMTGKESEIFAPAFQASLYNYEKVELHLKKHIAENYKLNDKLPAMGTLAEELKVSSNTIRKALQNLADKGIVSFSRGRYGGTFVTQMPETSAQEKAPSLEWLAVNPEIAGVYSKQN